MPDKDEFRRAWGQFATGVTVVTTLEPDGQVHGMTANALCSVSLEPLLVLISVGHNRHTYPLIEANGRFGISILKEDQQSIAEYYTRDPKDRTGDVTVAIRFTGNGTALVDGCLAGMDCHMVSSHVAGDHTIYVAEVDEIGLGKGTPLIFHEGRYSSLGNPVIAVKPGQQLP